MELLLYEDLDHAAHARLGDGNPSVLLGTGQYSKAIPSGPCAKVSFDPVERTEGDDTDRQKAEVK